MDTMLPMLGDVAAFVLVASLKGGALAAAVLLIQKLAGKYLTAGTRYLLWMPVVVGLLTPVGVDIPLLPATAPVVAPSPAGIVEAPKVSAVEHTAPAADAASPDYSLPVRSTAAGPRATSTPSYSWGVLLPYFWLAGVLAVLGAIAVASLRFARIVRRAVPAASDVQDLLEECMEQTGCAARVRVLLSTDVDVPMIAGLFRPVLLLPGNVQLSRAQLRHVFLHELMHLQRGDILGNWVVALTQAVHWFNPAIWFAFSRLRQDRELACDAATLKYLPPTDRAAYGHTLLQLNDTPPGKVIPAVALGIVESSSHLRTRILMLVESSRYGNVQSLVAAFVLLPLATVAFGQPVSRVSEPVVAAEPAAIAPATPRAEPATSVAVPMPVAETSTTEPAEPTAVASAEPVVETPEPVSTATPASGTLETELMPSAPPLLDAPPVSAALLIAANTIEARIVDVTQVEPAPAARFAGLAEVLQLGEEIAAVKAANISFIEEWNAIAASCEARRERLLGSVSKPCRQVTKALARSEIIQFGAECFALNTRQRELTDSYRVAEPQGQSGLNDVKAALLANAMNLAAFCSKETYASLYPAFGDLLARAEAMTYVTRRGGTRAFFPNSGYGIHGSSMDTGSAAFSAPSSHGFPVFNFPVH